MSTNDDPGNPFLSDERLREIRERVNVASPAPWWRTDPPWGNGTTVHAGPTDDPHTARCYIADGDVPADEMIAPEVVYNMTFIAAARDDVPALLAYVNALKSELSTCQKERTDLEVEIGNLRTRLLSAAGDDLCRLTQEEIKAYTSGAVQIPPKSEFMPSCERFHDQISGTAGVLTNCLTLAQLIAENERLRSAIEDIDQTLRVPAAEYVPAISDVFTIIDGLKVKETTEDPEDARSY